MRIGILTHHYVKNYGAFLQMKAMYETLRRLYPKAEIVVVNYVNPRHWRKNIIHILHFRFGIDPPATYIKKIQQLQTFTKYEHTIPRTHSVKSAEEIATLKLDLIVLGSDEIWNLCGSGYHPLKFGTGLEEQQTIAYAPSVGAVTEDTEVPAEVASGLKNIDFDADIKKDNIQLKPYKYILIYDCKLTPSMVEELKQYAQNNSLKIIGAGDYKTYYDEGFINLSPYEWVDLFRNAEKIITGTFHGTVFSIKYEKPVVCYPTEKNRINKIHSLLEDMKIPSRLLEIGREKELINMLNKPMNYMQTQEYIARKVQEADEFLVGEKR